MFGPVLAEFNVSLVCVPGPPQRCRSVVSAGTEMLYFICKKDKSSDNPDLNTSPPLR